MSMPAARNHAVVQAGPEKPEADLPRFLTRCEVADLLRTHGVRRPTPLPQAHARPSRPRSVPTRGGVTLRRGRRRRRARVEPLIGAVSLSRASLVHTLRRRWARPRTLRQTDQRSAHEALASATTTRCRTCW